MLSCASYYLAISEASPHVVAMRLYVITACAFCAYRWLLIG